MSGSDESAPREGLILGGLNARPALYRWAGGRFAATDARRLTVRRGKDMIFAREGVAGFEPIVPRAFDLYLN